MGFYYDEHRLCCMSRSLIKNLPRVFRGTISAAFLLPLGTLDNNLKRF